MADKLQDWSDLIKLTQGRALTVERIRLADDGTALEGRWELPQLARLSASDQIFVVAFVRSHGSIKEMERVFGVSYPTIKARLNRLSESLDFIETNPAPSRAEIRRERLTSHVPVSPLWKGVDT